MRTLVVHGATLKCNQGTTPSNLVIPDSPVISEDKPAASVADRVAQKNILPFGMCRSTSNPQVASATSAAGGVLTPQPCIPMTQTNWEPGAAFAVMTEINILTSDSTCKCAYAGTIDIVSAGTSAEIDEA